jgi:hypothetical protein
MLTSELTSKDGTEQKNNAKLPDAVSVGPRNKAARQVSQSSINKGLKTKTESQQAAESCELATGTSGDLCLGPDPLEPFIELSRRTQRIQIQCQCRHSNNETQAT